MAFAHTIGRIIDLATAATPNRLAVTLDEEALSFAQLDRRANALARTLLELGLRRGDRLLYWSPISLRAMEVFVATQRIGVAFAPIKDVYSVGETIPLVEYLKPRLLLADAALADKVHAVADATGVPLQVMGGAVAGGFESLLGRATDATLPPQGVVDEDIHAIFLTSGSTGQPKGVMVSHRASWNRSFYGNARSSAMGGRGDINMFPLFHWAGWHYTLIPWIHGRAAHLTTAADAATLAGLIDRWGPSYMYGIPAIWERLLAHDKPFETGTIRWAGTGTYRVEPQLVEAIKAKFPRAFCTIGWGATEFGVGVQIEDDDIAAKPYSVGLPAPGNEFRIVDGELWGRGEQMMTGYFELPDMTAEVMHDGWYRTGDLAEQDEDGYFYITGRAREIIRSGAETIAPAEVEAAIRGFAGIAEVSVVGLPDQSWGEVVCAAVVLAPGAEAPTVEALREHLAPKLARFKHPRKIVTLASIPRTPATGQIQRSLVRQTILAGE